MMRKMPDFDYYMLVDQDTVVFADTLAALVLRLQLQVLHPDDDLLSGPSFAYSLPMHPVYTRRDRVASLPPCCLYGAVIPRAPTTGPSPDLAMWLE